MEKFQVTEAEFAELKRRSRELDEREPRIAAFEVIEADTLTLRFQLQGNAVAGAVLSFPAAQIPGLQNASAEQLRGALVTANGSSIRWPELDFGIGAPALVGFACGLCEPDLKAKLHRFEALRNPTKNVSAPANASNGAVARRQTAASV